MPAENAVPAPVSTSTLQRGSISSAFSTASISVASAGLMALRFSGRFIVTQAIPSSNSTSTVLPPGTGADEWASVDLVVTGSISLPTRVSNKPEQ